MKDSALTLEKMEINKRIGELEKTVAMLNARFESEFGGKGNTGNIYRLFDDLKVNLINLSKEIARNELVGREDFQGHIIQDRWMFGILATMLIGMFVKLFLN